MANEICFSHHQMGRIFPYYLLVNKQLNILAAGPALLQLASVNLGDPLQMHFAVHSSAAREESSFVQIHLKHNAQVLLNGHHEVLNDSGDTIYLVVPVFAAINEAIPSPFPNIDEFRVDVFPEPTPSSSRNQNSSPEKSIAESAQPANYAFTDPQLGATMITDKFGLITWVDERFADLFKSRPEKLITTPFADLLSSDADKHRFERLSAAKEPFVMGYNNKSLHNYKLNIRPFFNEQRALAGYTVQIEGGTEEEIERLPAVLNHWKTAIEESDLGIWVYYIKPGSIRFSTRYKKLLGYNDHEYFDMAKWLDALHPEDIDLFANEIMPKLTRSSPEYQAEIRMKNKGGNYHHYRSKGKVVEWDEDGQPSVLAGTLTNINENILKDAELKTSVKWLRTLINNLNSGVLYEREDRTLIFINKRFCELMSLPNTPDELIGINCRESLSSGKGIFKDPELFEQRVNGLIDTKKRVLDEVIHMQDGSVYTRDFIPVEGAYLWIYSDITEKTRYEERLKAQQEYYLNILNEVPAEIVITAKNEKFQYISKSAVKDEVVREWLIGKDTYDYCRLRNMDVAIADLRAAYFREAVSTKQPVRFVEEHDNPRREPIYMLRVFYPALDKAGEFEYMIGYGINITDQVRNKRNAELQENRVRDLLEIIKDGVFHSDENGFTNLYNDSFLHILEIRGNKFTKGDSVNILDLLSGDDLEDVQQRIKLLLETGMPQFGMFQVTDTSGEIKYIEFAFRLPAKTEEAAFIGRVSDITAIVNRERDLQRIIKQEQYLNNSKSQFVRITSHELRTPLAIILANAEIMEMVLAKPETERENFTPGKMTQRIIKEVAIMTEILNELMTISRIESGNMQFNFEPVNVPEFLSNLKSELYAPYSDGRTLTLEIGEGVGLVNLDKKLMRHAVINLISNAFKYSFGKKEPMLSVRKQDKTYVFEMRDYGIGIPEDDKKKIFESFFRASNVGSIQGTGLGLMVIDYVVKKHDGNVYFESILGQGSTFTIVIPES